MPVSHSLGWLHGCPESHTIPVSVMQEEVESRHYRDEKQGTEKTKARHLSASSLLALDLQNASTVFFTTFPLCLPRFLHCVC